MYTQDIQTTLDHVKRQIAAIRINCEKGEVHAVEIKNTLENLRSTLDYVASDLNNRLDKLRPGTCPAKVYFPYGQRENHFKISIKKNLPNLEKDLPKVYALIEAAQPFKSKDNWIVDLCALTNEAKHNGLTKASVNRIAEIRQPGIHIRGTNIVMQGNTFNGVPMDDVTVNSMGDVSVRGNSGKTWVLIENIVKFNGKNLEIAPFLEKCYSKLTELATQIGKNI